MSQPFTIRCRENGPLVMPATVQIVDADGNAFPIPPGKEVVALCRCGATKNRPFCDGAHKAIGFIACEKATPPVARYFRQPNQAAY